MNKLHSTKTEICKPKVQQEKVTFQLSSTVYSAVVLRESTSWLALVATDRWPCRRRFGPDR